MLQLLIIFAFFISTLNVFSQIDYDITNFYNKIFKIERISYNGEKYLHTSINNIDSNNYFSDFVNHHILNIDYLFKNFSDNSNFDKLDAIDDSTKLQQEFISDLKNDTLFNSLMSSFFAMVCKKSDFIQDTISFDELVDVAVKFFYIPRITENGHYTAQVCVAINGIKETEKIRKPQIEAFCFSTIFRHYRDEKYNLYYELLDGINELNLLNLGIDKAERLLRAQGALYMFMKKNKKLKNLLLSEYNSNKDLLPFVLVN